MINKIRQSAVLRLSLIYLVIIMAICVGFSSLLYTTTSQELSRELRRPTPAENLSLPHDFNIDSLRNSRLHDSQQRLRVDLIILNITTLIAAGWLSYYAARRTIQPIENALLAQSRFASDASHELRTPLAAMRTEIEVALRDPSLKKAELHDLLVSNLEETNRLQELTEGLLLLARQTDASVEFEPVDVTAIVHKAWQRVSKAASQKDITLADTSIPAQLWGNQPALTELVAVLLDNAVKYSSTGQAVTVTGQPQDNHYVLSVTDQGTGIPADQQPHIFERFYQADSSRANQGYGLGLAIAGAIVDKHNGDITVTSQLGQGTTFSVQLPLSPTDATTTADDTAEPTESH